MPASLLPRLGSGRFIVGAATALAALVVVSTATSRAVAQTKEIGALKNSAGKEVDLTKYKNDLRQLNQLRGVLLPLMQSGKAATPVEAEQFETYYLVKIAELTWSTKDATEIKRYDLKRKDLRAFSLASSSDLHDKLNAILLAQLPQIVADDQLALNVRYNALLLLGQLDKTEPNSAASQAAVPLPDGTPPLIAVLNKADFPESLRIAALVGMTRQSELAPSGQARAATAAEIVKLVANRKPAAGFSLDGYRWARKLAVQATIGLSKSGGEMNRPEVVKGLYETLVDDQEPLFLRRDAALALGNLDPAALASGAVKPTDLVLALARLTHTVTRAGSPREPPGVPPSLLKAEDVFAAPTEDNKKLFADGVAYYLNCIATALGGRNNRGMKAIAGLDPKTAGMVRELLNNHVDPLLVVLGNPRTVPQAMVQELTDRGGKLNAWLQANAPPPAAAGS